MATTVCGSSVVGQLVHATEFLSDTEDARTQGAEALNHSTATQSATAAPLNLLQTSQPDLHLQGHEHIRHCGYLPGDPKSAVELQYIGNGHFVPLSHEGTIIA